MTVVAIDHIQLAMPAGGEASAQDFYEGLLGLRRVPKPPHLDLVLSELVAGSNSTPNPVAVRLLIGPPGSAIPLRLLVVL